MFFFAKCYSMKNKWDINLVTYIHQRIPIDQCFLHFNQFNIVISQCKAVPKDISICSLPSLSVAKLANHVLDSVNFMPTVCRIYNDIFASPIWWLDNTHHLCTVSLLSLLGFAFIIYGLWFLNISRYLILLLLFIILLLQLPDILGERGWIFNLSFVSFALLVGSYRGGSHVIGIWFVVALYMLHCVAANWIDMLIILI